MDGLVDLSAPIGAKDIARTLNEKFIQLPTILYIVTGIGTCMLDGQQLNINITLIGYTTALFV